MQGVWGLAEVLSKDRGNYGLGDGSSPGKLDRGGGVTIRNHEPGIVERNKVIGIAAYDLPELHFSRKILLRLHFSGKVTHFSTKRTGWFASCENQGRSLVQHEG